MSEMPGSPAAAGQAFFPIDSGGMPGPAQAWQRRPYSQLLRGPNFAWWRPLISAAVVLAGLGVMVVAMAAVTVAAMSAEGAISGTSEVSASALDDWALSPTGLLLTNLSVAAFILCAQAGVWVGFGWRPRWLSSVVGRVRWRWLALSFVTSVAVLVLGGAVVDLILAAATGRPAGFAVDPESRMATYLLVILATTPLQAAGEEYLFRGWLSQAVGSWFSRAAVGAVVAASVSGIVFAAAHGHQDAWLFADRFAFALAASWLVWRTGGLEATVALHTAYNLFALGIALVMGRLGTLLEASESDPGALLVNLIMLAVVVLLLDRIASRLGLQREFRPPGVP